LFFSSFLLYRVVVGCRFGGGVKGEKKLRLSSKILSSLSAGRGAVHARCLLACPFACSVRIYKRTLLIFFVYFHVLFHLVFD
ncbi:hypothetical protein T02_15811, partial [Trichinella nativa]